MRLTKYWKNAQRKCIDDVVQREIFADFNPNIRTQSSRLTNIERRQETVDSAPILAGKHETSRECPQILICRRCSARDHIPRVEGGIQMEKTHLVNLKCGT